MNFSELIYNILIIMFLGLLVAFNPLLIAVDFLLVLKSKRPIFNSVILLAGFTASIFLLFILANLIIEPNSQISIQKLKNDLDVPPWIDLTAGLMMVFYGIKKYQRPKANSKISKFSEMKIPQQPRKIFAFALVKTSLSLTNIFAVLILAKQAVVEDWSIAIGMIAIIFILIIGILPLAYLMYLHWFKKQSLLSIDKRLNNLLTRDTTNLLAYGLVLIGLLFILKGLIGIG